MSEFDFRNAPKIRGMQAHHLVQENTMNKSQIVVDSYRSGILDTKDFNAGNGEMLYTDPLAAYIARQAVHESNHADNAKFQLDGIDLLDLP